MLEDLMELIVLLPATVFGKYINVTSIVFETPTGAYGLLPNRLDCVGILESGLLTYTVSNTPTRYIAVDEGVLVKVGNQVRVSVRDAHADNNLEQLTAHVSQQLQAHQDQEREMRTALTRLESGFMQGIKELHTR
jgi:F-type H+-transporting ATPase subunit epsilon